MAPVPSGSSEKRKTRGGSEGNTSENSAWDPQRLASSSQPSYSHTVQLAVLLKAGIENLLPGWSGQAATSPVVGGLSMQTPLPTQPKPFSPGPASEEAHSWLGPHEIHSAALKLRNMGTF